MACKTTSDQETASLGNVGFLEPARKAVRPSMRSLAFLPPLPSARMATAAPPPDTQEGRSLVRVRPSALECTTNCDELGSGTDWSGLDWRIFQIGGSGEKCHFATIWKRGASQGCETDHGCQRNRSVRQSVLGRRSGSRLIATYSPYSQASPSPRDLSPLSSSSSSTTTSENEPALRCVWRQMRSVGQKKQRKRLREMRV